MAARTTSPTLTPALIAKMSPGGRGARGALNYDSQKDGARLLWTNLEGTKPRQWARQMKAFLSLNPRCRRGVDHVSLSLDPRLGTLPDDQWIVALKAWLRSMGYGDRAVVCHLHTDEPQQHIHAVVCRTDAAGKVHADGGNWKRSHVAAVHAAEAIGLKPVPPRPDAARLPAPTDSQLSANKRAERRGTKVQNHASASRIFEYVVSKSADLAELESRSLEAGLDLQIVRKSNGSIQGLNVKFAGAEEWLKASNLKSDRSLSWTKVEVRLASNLELRERARAQAEQVARTARDRAEQRVAARLDRQPQRVPQPARAALSPTAITAAKEATMTDETLDFLNPTPLPRPAALPLDDADLMSSSTSAADEALARHKKKQKTGQEDRDQAKLDLLSAVQALSIKELLDLKSAVPPLVMTAAAIEALVSLMIRLLTLGIVKPVGNLSSALAARQELQQLGAAELDRRRRTPVSAVARIDALNEYANAVQQRSDALDKRNSDRKMWDLHRDRAGEAAALREQLEAGFDRLQTSRGHETIKKRRAAHEAAVVAHRAALDEDLVPAGFAGWRITKARRAAAAVEKTARSLKLKRAAELRESTEALLNLFLNEVKEAALKHRQEAADAEVEVKKAEALERDLLARELRDLPDQLRAVSVEAERAQHRTRGVEIVAEYNLPKTPAELSDAELERLRQFALADRRG